MRSPINLYHVTTLEEPSQWAPEPICEPDYRALGVQLSRAHPGCFCRNPSTASRISSAIACGLSIGA
jgi:hypothetical protein